MCHVPVISLLPVLLEKYFISLNSFRLQCSIFGTTPVLDGTKWIVLSAVHYANPTAPLLCLVLV